MKRKMAFIGVFLLFFYCKTDTSISFTEFNAVYDESAVVEINIPKAKEDNELSNTINSTLEQHIANILNFSEDDSNTIQLEDAVKQFQSVYNDLRSDHQETALIWEAMFDGEVIYQSPEVICIAINAYTNTGGAHGNMNITLFNFDPQTAKVLDHDAIISEMDAFTEIVESHFSEEIKARGNDLNEDFMFEDGFHLPANIGFNEEGVLILYNVYEIASYAQGITEFTIPFEKLNSYLRVR